jgi:hypothetical protein
VRATRRRRPHRRTLIHPPQGIRLEDLAAKIRYVGSPEHKDRTSFAGKPRPRADASICTASVTQKQAQAWLVIGLRLGNIGAPWEKGYPRYIWYLSGDIIYEARLVNRDTGEYKGYPLRREELPKNVREHNGQASNKF